MASLPWGPVMSISDELTKNLTSKQRAAVSALLEGKTQAQAATAAGVSAKTVWRWLADNNDFQTAVKGHSILALKAARVQLAGSLETAVETIIDIMTMIKPNQGSGTRLRAAGMVLDNALRMAEMTDVLERLEAIEAKLSGAANEQI